MEYPAGEVASFSRVDAPLGELGNFCPLPNPAEALGRWWRTGEALYQALKFPGRSDVQSSIAKAEKPIVAKGYVLRVKREANRQLIDEALKRTGTRPIVEVSHRGDDRWGAVPRRDKHVGHNVLGQLWVELREQIRADLPTAASHRWRHVCL